MWKCRICGKNLAKVRNGKTLRRHGFCYEHLDKEFKCQARTNSNNKCLELVEFGSSYCKIHKCKFKYTDSISCENRREKLLNYCPEHKAYAPPPYVVPPTEIRAISYNDYLLSSNWKSKSNEAKKRAGYRCQLCNSNGQLNTHHRTYERLGNEYLEDLIVLCRRCHVKFHDIVGENVP